jgi:hypothetical protein
MLNYNQPMKIALGQDDSPDFIDIVEGLVNGFLIGDAPPSLMLIKIDNWFGSKWLGFSGKILGALGVSKGKLTIPPFVPNRVLSERKVIGPPYSEAKHDSPIHISVPSSVALTRRVDEVAPGAILFWYSGGSLKSGRGSAMAYVPTGDAYCNWYAEWASSASWHLVKWTGVQPEDLAKLMNNRQTQ